jgi:hypothetical protein
MCIAIIERNCSKNGRSKIETIGDYLQVMFSFVETDSQQKRVRGIHDQSGVFTRKLLFSDVLFKTMHQIRFCLRGSISNSQGIEVSPNGGVGVASLPLFRQSW